MGSNKKAKPAPDPDPTPIVSDGRAEERMASRIEKRRQKSNTGRESTILAGTLSGNGAEAQKKTILGG